MERIKFTDLKRRVSWGSVIGGVVTVMAISVLLAILATSISLFMLDPQSSDPASGIGTNVGIWTVVAFIISFTAGGFVAGKLAGADGMIHGFLVWATTTIVSVVLTFMLISGAVKLTGNILGSVSSVAGSMISGVGSAIGTGVSNAADRLGGVFEDMDIDGNVDMKEVRQDVRQALRRSGIPELQPEYLQKEMRATRSDLQRAVKTLVRNPNDADKVIDRFTNRLSERADKITRNIDRDQLTQAIANNSSMSKAEVDRTVDEYIELFNNAKEKGQEQIENLQETIDQAKQEWEVMKQDAREAADKATNAAARSALWSFIALLIGAILCVVAGSFGTKKTQEGYDV